MGNKETCIDVKNAIILLISNLVFQIIFQAVFHCDCVKKCDAACGKLQANCLLLLAFFTLDNILIINTNYRHLKMTDSGKLLLLMLLFA